MQTLLRYNFDPNTIADENYAALYETRRRDAVFAYVGRRENTVTVIRDHLGTVPVFCRGGTFATDLQSLVTAEDTIDPEGAVWLAGLGTPKLRPLISDIQMFPPGSATEIDTTTGEQRLIYQYRFKPRSTPSGLQAIVDEIERLFFRAMERIVQADSVGVYLSGGIDSGMIGTALKKMGVPFNAYTSAPWGANSSEIAFARQNATHTGAQNHYVDVLETDQYEPLLDAMPRVYGLPHGTTTGLGVTSLWENTPIAEEKQLFFGQNSDTMTCTMPAQYMLYLAHRLPALARRRYGLTHNDLLTDYAAFVSKNLVADRSLVEALCDITALNRLQQLTVAGMAMGHTPKDCEVVAQPAIFRDILVANPYYDVDLIEFCMGIPLRHRVAFSRRTGVMFEKRVLQHLALRHLPAEIVHRKKAFIVPFTRDVHSRTIAAAMPKTLHGHELSDIENRFAAASLQRWTQSAGLSHST